MLVRDTIMTEITTAIIGPVQAGMEAIGIATRMITIIGTETIDAMAAKATVIEIAIADIIVSRLKIIGGWNEDQFANRGYHRLFQL